MPGIIHVSKLREHTTVRVDSNVNYGFWVILCQCKLTLGNKSTTPVNDAANGGGYVCTEKGAYGNLCTFLLILLWTSKCSSQKPFKMFIYNTMPRLFLIITFHLCKITNMWRNNSSYCLWLYRNVVKDKMCGRKGHTSRVVTSGKGGRKCDYESYNYTFLFKKKGICSKYAKRWQLNWRDNFVSLLDYFLVSLVREEKVLG